MPVLARLGAASRLALAATLASGLAIGAASPALAAKKEEKKEAAAGPKTNYSKPFVTVYQPFAAKVNAGGDLSPLKAEVETVVGAATTPDDRYAAGQITYSLGNKLQDIALQRRGLVMMTDGGSLLAGADRGKLLYAQAQLAYNDKDWAEARTRAEQAIAAGYANDAELLISESYFAQDQDAAGLDALDKAIAKKVASGQPVPEAWLKRGLATAYQANLEPQALKFAAMFAQYYPSEASWGDAIAIQRNLRNYEPQEILDLMRLAMRAKAMRTERDYVEYISAADPRRLPGETQRIIAAGIAAGKLKSNDVFVADANSTSLARVKADTADLPNLARDARLPNATVSTLSAAGDAFLSYGKNAEAEEFYKLALAKPGIDTARILTRLGIAQFEQGKVAEAQANFARVEGARQAIAQLWALHATQAAAATANP